MQKLFLKAVSVFVAVVFITTSMGYIAKGMPNTIQEKEETHSNISFEDHNNYVMGFNKVNENNIESIGYNGKDTESLDSSIRRLSTLATTYEVSMDKNFLICYLQEVKTRVLSR